MGTHIVIDGTAFYEVDDDCLLERQEEQQRRAGLRDGSLRRTEGSQRELGREGEKRRKNRR